MRDRSGLSLPVSLTLWWIPRWITTASRDIISYTPVTTTMVTLSLTGIVLPGLMDSGKGRFICLQLLVFPGTAASTPALALAPAPTRMWG